jgi:predicted Zn-dependent protease
MENRTTPLLKLVNGERQMSPKVQITEVPGAGFAPRFQESGFVRPDRIPLIEKGLHAGSLISPRSAKEHGIQTNGASASEQPISLEMAPGNLPAGGLLEALGTGIWVSNLWYLNFSDRAAGRITGMTRFATFWVENGQIVSPLSVMRFDDTFYNCLGDHLEALSHEAELQLSAETYFARSTSSARVPGALVHDFALTL